VSKKNMLWLGIAAVVAYFLWKRSKVPAAPLALTLPGVAGGTTFNPLDPLSTATAIADATAQANQTAQNAGGAPASDDVYGPAMQSGDLYTSGQTPPIVQTVTY
jgi:hypothetical protein